MEIVFLFLDFKMKTLNSFVELVTKKKVLKTFRTLMILTLSRVK